MISPGIFARIWQLLEQRWGKQPTEMATEYRNFLGAVMDDEDFERAGRALWASREFFPRPADFLLLSRTDDWLKAMQVLEEARKDGKWFPTFEAMSDTGRRALQALGGVFVAREQWAQNPAAFRRSFAQEYEAAVADVALDIAKTLPAGQGKLALKP